MPRPIKYNATLRERKDLSPTLARFVVNPDRPASQSPWFKAGQYVTVGLNNEAQPDLGPVRRPLSIASCPTKTQDIELYVRYVSEPASENPLTHLLWQLQPKDRLFVRPAAAGDFTLEPLAEYQAPPLRVMVASGTGLAPFISMLRHELAKDPKADLSGFALLHGASLEHDLGYRQELEHMARTHKLRYRPTLSRPEPSWQGPKGRVEHLFDPPALEDTLKFLEGPDGAPFCGQHAAVWICGLTGTVVHCIRSLLPLGFVPHHRRLKEALGIAPEQSASLFFEQYDVQPPFDLKDPAVVAELQALYRPSQ